MVVKKKKAVKRASAKVELKAQARTRRGTRAVARPAGRDPSREMAVKIAGIASDRKALDVVVLDLRSLTSFTDYFVIASGASDRQVEAIAQSIREGMKKAGRLPISEEGMRSGRWALIDYGDVVTHIFYTAEREYYALEKLWYDAPRVKLK